MFCRSRRLLRSGKGPPAPDRHKNLIALVGEGRHWQRRRSCATCKGLGLCKMSTRSPSSKGGAQIPMALGTPSQQHRLVHSIFAANTTSTTVEYQGTAVHARADAYAHGSL